MLSYVHYRNSALIILEFGIKILKAIRIDCCYAYEYESMDLMTITDMSEGKFKNRTSHFREPGG